MRRVVLVLAVTALIAPAAVRACPICGPGGETLSQSVEKATMVLYGKMSNANEDKDTTDLEIEVVIKDHELRGKKTKLTLGRFIDLSFTTDNDRYLVFCDLYKGKIDPYKGMAVKKGSKLPEYLRGSMKVKDKTIGQRLRFFFDYLDSADLEISSDAYFEFANSDYKDFKPMAKDLPADRVSKWLKDAETPANRIGLFAWMLGHCGKESDAAVLKAILDDPDRRAGSGIHGVLAAYTLLKRKEGWKYLQDALKDTKEDFTYRYAALKAVRVLHDDLGDVIPKADLEEAVCSLLTQEDIADLAIEDLRKWEAWDKVDKVLAVRNTEVYGVPIIKRAILRYCLQCKDKQAAKDHVEARRKADPEAVEQAKELLQLEREAAGKKTVDTTKKK
jgi:hypothetical protein